MALAGAAELKRVLFLLFALPAAALALWQNPLLSTALAPAQTFVLTKNASVFLIDILNDPKSTSTAIEGHKQGGFW